MVAMEATFSARVDCTTTWTMVLMSTFGNDAEVGEGGAWGAGTVGVREEKAVHEEATVKVWSHERRGDCSRKAGGGVMLVGEGRLPGSWIWKSAACLLRSPQTDA